MLGWKQSNTLVTSVKEAADLKKAASQLRLTQQRAGH